MTTTTAILLCTMLTGEPPLAQVHYAFDAAADLEPCKLVATGEAAKRMPEPKIYDGKLLLLESWWKSTAAVAIPAPTTELGRIVDLSWTLIMNTGTEGAGFAWIDVTAHGNDCTVPELERWEAPSIERAFGIGFDASNPPNRDPFRGSGNVYDRPQHEVSLHWNGREIIKRTTPMDFRDEKPHAVRARLEFVVGGADVSLWIDDEPIFEGYFIPSMTAYVGRPVFGATNLENAGDILLDELHIACTEPIDPPAAPMTIVALDRVLNDKKRHKNDATVEFPSDTSAYGRIVCTLRLDKPETRFDPWDRLAHIYVLDDEDGRFEILRYITPYHKGHVWQVDVTDMRPLLTGERRLRQDCTTYGEGWLVSVSFDYYPGPSERQAYEVIKLWSGGPEIGNPDKPVTDFYVPRDIVVDEGAVAARIKTVVTGHGMNPNSGNAAEFMPIWRTLTVNGEAHRNRLWKTDNYLNPCRPQGGTWKYDRAGWAPGDVVTPWEIDVTHLLDESRSLRIEYTLDDYVNENRGQTWAPTHQTEAVLVLYD